LECVLCINNYVTTHRIKPKTYKKSIVLLAIYMTKKSKNSSKNPWAIAKTKYRLNARQKAMAKELGMNPKKLGKLVPNKSQQWKSPRGEFIEKLYRKRFGDKEPVLYNPHKKK